MQISKGLARRLRGFLGGGILTEKPRDITGLKKMLSKRPWSLDETISPSRFVEKVREIGGTPRQSKPTAGLVGTLDKNKVNHQIMNVKKKTAHLF